MSTAETRAVRAWTPAGLVVSGLDDLAHAPVRAILYLGVLPGIWMAPTFLEPLKTTAASHPGLWLLLRIGTAIWDSVVAGGVFLAALNIVRRVPVGLPCFINGFRYWFRIATLALLLSLPLVIVSLARPFLKLDDPGKGLIVAVFACVAIIAVLILMRMVTAVLLVVDRDARVVDALSGSWHSTARARWRIAVLLMGFMVPVAAWAIWWRASVLGQQIGWMVIRPVCLLVWVHLYQQLQRDALSTNPKIPTNPGAR
jgi:hypothetical protein